MSLRLPQGDFRSNPETEELRTAREFSYSSEKWDALSVAQKERLIAYLRDEYDIQRVALMSEDEQIGLGGALGWVRVTDERRR